MKGNKIFWIVLIVVIVAAALWIAIPEIKKLKAGATGGTGATGGSTGTGSKGNTGGSGVISLNMSKSLYKGVTGNEVRELQRILNGYTAGGQIAIDGIFGNQTYNKLIAIGLTTPITLTMIQNYAGNNNSNAVASTGSSDSGFSFWGWLNQYMN